MENYVRAYLLVRSDPDEQEGAPVGNDKPKLSARTEFDIEAAIAKEWSEPARLHWVTVDLTLRSPRWTAAIDF